MRFASLGSGSRGNGTLIEAGATRLLLDCGFSVKETQARLARLGCVAEDLTAIVVTHEHSDHIGGVAALARRFGLPVWLTAGTFEACRGIWNGYTPDVHVFSSHAAFAIDGIEVSPFPVPHDAREPCQFVFSDGYTRIGVLTDTGSITPHIEACLGGCHALLLECNHDIDMLRNGSYPPPLKARIAGQYGHLDNATAAGLLSRLDTAWLQYLAAVHLSEKNNHPELVRAALSHALDCDGDWIKIADQDRGLNWHVLDN